MDKKIGIVTIDSFNYGNRLQNLAVTNLLMRYSKNVTTFKREYNELNKKTYKTKLKFILGRISCLFNLKCIKKYKYIYNFEKFNYKYIRWDNIILEKSSDEYINENYDMLVCGSDQVWNFKFNFNSHFDILAFADEKIQRVALCASIGNVKIDDKSQKIFDKHLNRFDGISVREKSAEELLKNIRSDIITLLDPTMLVETDFWNSLIKNLKRNNSERYILIYFLGNISEKVLDFTEQLSEMYSLKIVNINDINDEWYGVGPIEFIKLIKEAEYILTDSFHCCVFSILYNKKFSVYDRYDMQMHSSNRTDQLLSKFNICNRKNIYDTSEFDVVNYNNKDKILESERKKAEKFLKKVLT